LPFGSSELPHCAKRRLRILQLLRSYATTMVQRTKERERERIGVGKTSEMTNFLNEIVNATVRYSVRMTLSAVGGVRSSRLQVWHGRNS
jgi:hypothetical protein